MYRFVLRPRWLLGHLVVVLLVILMVNLGLWQLRRLDGRREVNASIRARQSAPPVALTDLVAEADPTAVEWRSTSVTGAFDDSHQVLVRTSGQSGDVITPLVLPDGRAVAIDRGVIAAVGEHIALPAAPTGTITVTGRVRRSAADRGFAEQGELDHVDVSRIGALAGRTMLPVYVELVGPLAAGPGQPEPVAAPELDDGPHLSYAVQWFLFSVSAVVAWPILIRASARRQAKARAAGAGKRADEVSPTAQPSTPRR